MNKENIGYLMYLAFEVSKQSPDIKTQVGCILLNAENIEKEGPVDIAATGFNFLANTRVTIDDWYGDEKHKYVLHAEVAAVLSYKPQVEKNKPDVAFVTHSPCCHCARILVAFGIKEVFYSIEKGDGLELLKEFGIKTNKVALFT